MRKSVWLVSAGLFALSTPAYAQSTDTDGKAAQPTDGATAEAAAVAQTATTTTAAPAPVDSGDIVVTATRRNEALSDVPLAVSAVTSETLENSGASDIRALTQVSPSLLVSSTSSEAGAGGARIRGVGTVGDNPGLESSVAVFIDGVYRSRVGLGLTELGQVDRIEVLRGPQGTLFGRNASAGLISIITAKPKFETILNGQVDIGNYNLRRLELGATGALSSTVAARVDAVIMKRDGFLEDVISGRDVNNRDRWLLRGQLLFQPSDNLSFRLIGDYSKRDEECCSATYLPAHDTTAAGEQPSSIAGLERALGAVINDDTFARNVSITPGRSYRSDVKDYGLSGELVYDLGGAELTSISAYRYNKYIRGQDADFNNLDILYRDDDGTAYNRFKTFSQELRLQGEAFGGKLDWLVGGYYANEKLRVRDNLAYGADYLKYANCLLVSSALPTALSPTAPSCINSAVITGNQTAVNTGVAQLTAGINALSAIPVALRTPAQSAQLAGLIAQRAALLPTQGLLNALNANPANPGFGSLANALGIPGANPFAGVGSDDLYNQTSNNFAVFTHNIFEITDGLKLTVGARYTRERKQLKANLTDNNVFCRTVAASPLNALQQLPCVIPSVAGGSFVGSSKKTEGKLSGTVVLSYKPTEQLLTYASFSRGYKGGGFNLDRSALPRTASLQSGRLVSNGPVCSSSAQTGCTGPASLDDLQFNPEINNAIEVGGKYNGRGFDVNLAVFQQSFDDFQLNLFNGIAFEVDTVNSCSDDLNGADTDNDGTTGGCTGKLRSGVRSRGVELEFFTRPMRDVTLNLGGIYANTRYRKNLVGANGDPTSAQLFQLPGRRLSNSSAFTVTASGSWTPRIGTSGLSGLLYIDARHSSEFNTGSDLDREKIQKPYTVVNGRIGIRGPDQAWAVELWAQNILNQNYKQVAFDAPLQGSGTVRGVEQGFYARSTQLFGAFLAEPRTYGLTLRAKISPAKAAPAEFVAPPAPVAPATQTCADGSVIAVDATCPVAPVEAPMPVPAPERG